MIFILFVLGPRTLCNACGVRYSRERQDKTKLRKCKKARSKPTGNTSTKKRPRALDPSQYDIAFLFPQKCTLTTPKCTKRSPVEDGFSGKEYAAALSLVSLAILGSTGGVSSSKSGPMKLDGSSRGLETDDLEVKHCCRTQTITTSSLSPELGSCRRSRRIMEAKRTPSQYYGGFNIEEWVPNFVDLEEGSGCEGTGASCVEDGVAVGVPCVWAAMSSLQDFCHHPSKKTTPPTVAHQDQSFLLQNPCPSSASNSAKSDVYTQQVKSNDHH